MRSVLDNALLNTMYKGLTTIQDFQWDSLTTVPILSLVSSEDINYIRKLITSPRYSGNNKLKMEKIDEVMHFRGFTKFAGGTNRLVYIHPSAPNAVFKVAIDAVGINDNPAEFRNQKFLKPYCCKVFECSPCGTIASFEKVDRITTFEEFYSIADDYFYLLSRVVLGKYVMEDIGIDYFMNIGIRKGFGVVILDFPYLFELDGAKLKCSNQLDDGTTCGGEIDYDHGFNKLVCSKCGRIYRARDLSKPPESGGLIIYKKGRKRMNIRIMEGDKVIKEVTTGVERDHLEKPTIHKTFKVRNTKINARIVEESVPINTTTEHNRVDVKKTTEEDTTDVITAKSSIKTESVKVVLNYGRKRTVLGGVNNSKSDHDFNVRIVTDDSDVKECILDHKKEEKKEEVKETTVEPEIIDECINEVDLNNCGTSSLEDTPIPIEQTPAVFEQFYAEINTEDAVVDEKAGEDTNTEETAEAEESSNEKTVVEESKEKEDDSELEDIIFIKTLPEDPEDNVAYCVPLTDDIDISVYEDGVDCLALVPSELFAIYISNNGILRRYAVDGDKIDIYDDKVEEQMKADAKDFDISPLMDNKVVDDEDAVPVDGDHFDEDAVIAQMKSASKKVDLDNIK